MYGRVILFFLVLARARRWPCIYPYWFIIFYTTLTLKTAAFVTCWAVNKWGNARPYTKSRKKSEKALKNIKKTILVRLRLFGEWKKRLFFGRLWNAGIKWKWSTATKVRSYSDNGTLSPLVHCSTDRWTIAYGTQLHDVQCLKMFRYNREWRIQSLSF